MIRAVEFHSGDQDGYRAAAGRRRLFPGVETVGCVRPKLNAHIRADWRSDRVHGHLHIGSRVTTPGATMVTEPVADFVGSTMLAAATVAVAFCATAGAV